MMSTLTRRTTQPPKRRRRPSVSDPTREKLLDVAGRIFADRGYRATTIREISIAAGANVAAVNYHFGDKLGLYTEAVQTSLRAAELDAIQNALNQAAPPQTILRAVIRVRLHSICRTDRPDWYFRILAHELAEPTPALRQLINKVGRPIFQRMLELIGGMIGLPAEDDKTKLCAVSVMGQILVYIFARPLLAGVWPDLKMTPDQIDRIADHIGDFSLAYIETFRPAALSPGTSGTNRATQPRQRK
ncbi:MAG TPA: CerR family C-terminal domain-containing protein [Acidobacteriaceae bacterium]|jgi:AcrR family transcriptional regulator